MPEMARYRPTQLEGTEQSGAGGPTCVGNVYDHVIGTGPLHLEVAGPGGRHHLEAFAGAESLALAPSIFWHAWSRSSTWKPMW